MILPLALVTTLRQSGIFRRHGHRRTVYRSRRRQSRWPIHRWAFPRTGAIFSCALDRSCSSSTTNRSACNPCAERRSRRAEKWLLDHMEDSEGLGAIFPPMVYMLIVFRALGYPDDHPRWCKGPQGSAGFFHRGRRHDPPPAVRFAGVGHRPGPARPGRSRIGRRIPMPPARRRTGCWKKNAASPSDWQKNCPDVEPSGWFFEFDNPHYPDVDDTAMVAMSLRRLGGEKASRAVRAASNGCWPCKTTTAAGRRSTAPNDRPILEKIPFADHNAMQDPVAPTSPAGCWNASATAACRDTPRRAAGHRIHPHPAGCRRRVVGPMGRQFRLRHLAGSGRPASRRAKT